MKHQEMARQVWGDALPEWVALLAEAVDAANQRAVAEVIGYSPAVVSQVLKGVYAGNTDRVRDAVLGAYAGLTVACPVLGDVPRQECLRYQREGYVATNPLRVRLYRACRGGCPHRSDGKGGGSDE